MHFGFDNPSPRRETESSKWNAYEEDILPMWVAGVGFTSPPPVIEALSKRVAHGVF